MPKKERSGKLKDLARSLCFLSPSFLGVFLFFILPFVVVVKYAFTNAAGEQVAFQNFVSLLKNPIFRMAAKNTLTFSAVAVPLSVILAIVLALMLECRIPMKSYFRSFFLSPMMVPVASIVLIWQVLFSYNGTVNVLLELLGKTPID